MYLYKDFQQKIRLVNEIKLFCQFLKLKSIQSALSQNVYSLPNVMLTKTYYGLRSGCQHDAI